MTTAKANKPAKNASKKNKKIATKPEPEIKIVEKEPVYFTQEAWDWLVSPVWAPFKKAGETDEPKAYSPVSYPGVEELIRFSEGLGVPLTLRHVQYLVRRDGEREVVCHVTDRNFIPIMWAQYCPSDLRDHIAKGGTLFNASIKWAGQINLRKNGKSRPLSGSPWHFYADADGTPVCEEAKGSPLYQLAEILRLRYHRKYPVWTCVPQTSLDEVQKLRTQRAAQRQKVIEMANDHEKDNDWRTPGRVGPKNLGSTKNAWKKDRRDKK